MKYLEMWENLRESNRILLIMVGFLLVVNLALIFIVISLSLKREIVVYLPPYEKVYVGGREYVLLWARYFTNLITNFNPENVEERVKLLARYAYSDDVKTHAYRGSWAHKERQN
ncbi:MAG: TraE/TraK family type IV conjugative transfer system protein [Aquificota bacterium]|nr:TraE/TraK family type IV conjugative transfer system protein [Aquificota bacterium]